MKLKKLAIMISIILLTIIISSFFNVANAATGSKYLGIEMLRKSGFGYRAGQNKNIWKIVEASNSSGSTINYNSTIYCIKGGPGFGSENYTEEIKHYTQYFDMKNPDSIPSPYIDALPNPNSTEYKALLWLLEHIYVPASENATSEEIAQARAYKQQLLEASYDYDQDEYGLLNDWGYLTDDDIEVVQQIAIWHFTNEGDAYDIGGASKTFELFLNSVKGDAGSGYAALSSEVGEGAEDGWYRADEAIALYRYLVDKAEEAAQDYTITPASQPYELADLNTIVRIEGNNYIIGPFKINRLSNSEATLEGKFTLEDGTEINPTLQNASGRRFNNLNDTIGQEFYIVVSTDTDISQITFTISGVYYNTKIEYWAVEDNIANEQPVALVEREETPYEDSVTVTYEEPKPEIFDLALRKFIVSINNVSPEISRIPQISDETLEDLKDNSITTAEKIHPKDPLTVETGDSVIYTIRVYNEGNVDGIVTEITDYLPDGLSLKANSSINAQYKWKDNGDGTITTNYLSGRVIPAFDGTTLSYLDVQIECEVTARVKDTDTSLKNIAEITGATNSDGEDMTDRDSTPDNVNVPGYGDSSQEDDDDFEDLVIPGKYFDLSLRKFIVQIDNETYSREPRVDVSPLVQGTNTTAIYNHPKIALGVEIGDEIIYEIRVYNEGERAGYVTEITDYLPANLEFVNDSFNTQQGWQLQADGRTVKTQITSDDLINEFNGTNLDYTSVRIKCKVKSTALPGEKLTNIAEITGFTDEYGSITKDRDSTEDNVTIPSDTTLPNYKDDEINRGDAYIPGQQDDDDFEKVVVEKFDLALRKFITGVNEETVTNRYPVFNNNNGVYTYTHTKEPVEVQTGDIVIYTIRVYNEGEISGYAEEIKDDLPEGLEFIPDNTTNINYRWVMYDANGEVTENVADAVTIRTDYLSKAQEDSTGRDNLIDAFDPNTMLEPDYKEVRIAFRVTEPNTSDRILINTAEISEDSNEDGEPVDDIDSTPDNDQDEEDDIDIEKVKVTYFDMALRKFIVSINGEAPEVSREPQISGETLANLENGTITTTEKLHTKTPLEVETGDSVIYTIRVYNEGEINGYVREITDYLPDGLILKADSNINAQYGWVDNGDGTITTDYLAGELIPAFDGTTLNYLDVQIECEVVAEKGTGEKSLKNIAEITKVADEDGNEDIKDRDSEEENLTEEQKNNYNPGTSERGYGYEDDDDYEELILPLAEGVYELKLIKENDDGEKLQGAIFRIEEQNEQGEVINTYSNLETNAQGEIETIRVAITGEGRHIYVITEEKAPEGYEPLLESIRIEVDVAIEQGEYIVTAQRVSGETKNIQVVDNTIEITINNEKIETFDLALRKFITGVNEEAVTNRYPVFNNNNGEYTYTHTKEPVEVQNGDIVTYTIRVYNEGNTAGYAEEIKDDLPEGLEFIPDNTTNINYRWVMYDANGEVTENVAEAVTIKTDYLSKAQEDATQRNNLIQAFDPNTMSEPDYKEVRIAFRVTEPNTSDRILINTAEISEDSNEDGEPVDDIDSTPDNDQDEEDDIDIEKVKVTYFDMALRKFIVSINGEAPEVSREPQISGETLANLENGTITTTEKLHTKTPLEVETGDSVIYTIRVYNEGEINGYVREITDYLPDGLILKADSNINAQYGWVDNGDGTITTDYLAGELIPAFDGTTLNYLDVQIECEVVAEKGTGEKSLKNIAEITKVADEDGNEDIKDRDSEEENLTEEQKNNYNPGTSERGYGYEDDDDYEELILPLAEGVYELKLIKENDDGEKLQGAIFRIEEQNEQGEVINTYSNLETNAQGEIETIRVAITGEGRHIYVITEEKAPEGYEPLLESIRIEVDVAIEQGEYIVTAQRVSGETKNIQVVDNTIEITINNEKIETFDLALRKFITGVNDEEIENRIPIFTNNNGEYTYTHTKEPIEVSNGDIIIYTLRVYNEGTQAGYAEEVKDDLPEGLEFLPDNEVNTEYRWVMYDANGEVTENVEEAVTIRTDYLSKTQEDEAGRDNLIEAFDPETMSQPDYKDLEIAFRVTEPNTSDRVLINTAEISEDSDEDGEPVDDVDSTPNNDQDGEDDIDIEKVKVTYFDLALEKIITKVTMTLDGETYVDETGHKFGEKPEEVVKVELGNHKIEDSVLKFTYKIRITNEGNKAGYAYEVKDYIPKGLEFVAEDNDGSWTLSEDGKTVTTDKLKDTLLEPGESADVEITLRWINGQTNLGVKTNWAEISKDSDDDIDSTPDNNKKGEDDIDDAEVVLSIVTGVGEYYMGVIITVLVILVGGIILIKRFVL